MATSSPYIRAERCFAVARSATFAGERDAAIGRGTAIAEAAGLSLDLFDVPGRVRRAWARGDAGGHAPRVARSAAPDRYDRDSLRDVTAAFRAHMRGTAGAMESFYAAMERREREVGARDGETVYEARRRNFDEATAETRPRDEAQGA